MSMNPPEVCTIKTNGLVYIAQLQSELGFNKIQSSYNVNESLMRLPVQKSLGERLISPLL